MSKKQKILTSIVGVALILLTLLGITYAYYLTRIEGNTNENSISITTAKLELLYGDGNEDLSFDKIMPGYDMEAKTFTVTNNGNSKVDDYAVALEEVTNTLTRNSDLTYSLTCIQKNPSGEIEGTCEGKNDIFPKINSMLVVNSIEVGYTHEYSLKVTYENKLDVDQSIDMGSTIKAKVQIYGLTDTLDLTGTVSNFTEGDYVQINSTVKKSNIVNNKYTLVGIKPGQHTLKVCSKDTNCETPKLSKVIVINKGETASVGTTIVDNVDVPLITMTNDSRVSNIDINATNDITVSTTIKEYDPNEGILAVNFTTSKNINLTTNKIVEDVDIKRDAVSIPFSVKNISDKHQNITIKLIDIEMDEALKNIDFRWGLYNADTEVGLSFGIFKYTTDEELIYTDTIIDAGTVNPNNYILRIWVHNNGTAQTALLNKSFKASVSVSSDDIEYTDESCFSFSNGTITGYNEVWVDDENIVSEECPSEIVIPKKINNTLVTKIGSNYDSAFSTMSSKVIIPNTVTHIKEYAFFTNEQIKHITIPESVVNIDYSAFSSTTNLSSLYIPESIENLGGDQCCSNFKYVVVPGSLSYLSSSIFASNDNMSDLILMNGIQDLGDGILSDTPGVKYLELPSSIGEIYYYYQVFNNSSLNKITVLGKTNENSGFGEGWNCKDWDYVNDKCSETIEVEYRP